MGHEVKLISPQFVKAYVKSNKNDSADAEAICEAVMRPTMRFVAIKSVEQQGALSLHRIRDRRVRNRTALVNEIRGLCAEYGEVFGEGVACVRKGVLRIVSDPGTGLSEGVRELFSDLLQELSRVEEEIEADDRRIAQTYRQNEMCQRLGTIPGVGPVTATAFVATIGDARVFRRGREVSAWLGLVPRQHSSGGKIRLGRISKRGDTYLRKLLVHGARSVLRTVEGKVDPSSQRLKNLRLRRGFNKACVALANKNARVAWALMASGQSYRAPSL
jgi:transposase